MSPLITLSSIVVLLVVYQLKHFLADYPLQRRWMLGKFRPDWGFVLPLAAHAGVHGLFTLLIAGLWSGSWSVGLWCALFDAAIHFLMDRVKASPSWLGRFKPVTAAQFQELTALPALDPVRRRLLRDNDLFWWSIGLDQMVHHLTHYAVIFYLLGR